MLISVEGRKKGEHSEDESKSSDVGIKEAAEQLKRGSTQTYIATGEKKFAGANRKVGWRIEGRIGIIASQPMFQCFCLLANDRSL